MKVTQFELGARLAWLLWASLPDDQLLDAAQAGQLSTPAQVAAQTRRMLDDPRARAGMAASQRPIPNRTALTMTALVLFSGAVEAAQLFAPGRHATLGDFVVDAGAACIGVALASLLARFWTQRG